jgi:N-methylhydantoinase B
MAGLDPITLSVLSHALSGVAEEMGAALIRSALSSNIKERRDCSTAVFDAEGVMVAQAEHIPVHLGAMPEAVRTAIERGPEPGDVFVVNDPYSGGTHLPDLTLVAPLSHDGQVVAYAVVRAHHSDIGGMSPGSMPSDSRDIFQEGLIVPPVRLVAAEELQEDVLELILANSRTRTIRLGDLRAQLGSCAIAQKRLNELIVARGLDVLRDAFAAVVNHAERSTRSMIAELPDGRYEAEGEMEGDGFTMEDIPIRVALTVSGDSLEIDFAGTSDSVAGNVNCPLAVTRSACLFAVRSLLPKEVPANAGVWRPLEIRARTGSLVNAESPSAVVAGNVETSQRIADVVLAAMAQVADVPAQGQGTMNNVVVGGGGWTYYETLGGGQGASRVGPGDSGVHVGMTNTLNTPIEALEMEFPMSVERYELEYDTGGAGVHHGGDGLIRRLRVHEDATLSLLSDRRRHRPAGAQGGEPGAAGENLLNDDMVASKASVDLKAGDVVEIRTPGGGGWGGAR